MAVSLKKGQGVRLKKEGSNEGLKSITLGLRWDSTKTIRTEKPQGFFSKLMGKETEYTERKVKKSIDLDSSILVCKNEKVVGRCFFGNLNLSLRGKQIAWHLGDDRSGSDKKTKKDNEQIKVNLSNISLNDADELYLVINAFSYGITFDEITEAVATIYGEDGITPLATFDFTNEAEFKGKTGAIVGKAYYNNGWQFEAIGTPVMANRLEEFDKYITK